MEQVLEQPVLMAEIKARLRQAIARTFRLDLQDVTWATLQAIIHPAQESV
jgi:hypothetical protein